MEGLTRKVGVRRGEGVVAWDVRAVKRWWGLSEIVECRGGRKWPVVSGTGLAGREMKGRDRNSDRRASDVPQAGRRGEKHREIEES